MDPEGRVRSALGWSLRVLAADAGAKKERMTSMMRRRGRISAGNNDRDDQDMNINAKNRHPRHAPVQHLAFGDVARLPRESNFSSSLALQALDLESLSLIRRLPFLLIALGLPELCPTPLSLPPND